MALECPRCLSESIRTVDTQKRQPGVVIRECICKACGKFFKSKEEVTLVMVYQKSEYKGKYIEMKRYKPESDSS